MTCVVRVEDDHEKKESVILGILDLPPFLVHELRGPGFPGSDVGL